MLNIHFIVQGDANPPDYLNERIEAFLVTFRAKLEEMPDSEFLENREAVIEKLLEKDKNLTEESYRYYSQITKGRYIFDKAKQMAEAVKTISKAEALELFDDYLAKGGKYRSRVSTRIYGKGAAMPIVSGTGEDGEEIISDLGEFKRGMDLWPLTTPPSFSEWE